MKITTTKFDTETLSAEKEIEIQGKSIETPSKALQVGKLRSSEAVSPLARGIAEVCREADAVALRNSRTGWEGLAERLRRQAEAAKDDEVVVPFIKYDDTAELSQENAEEIAKLQTNYGDMLTVPLMVPLVRGADDGDGRTEPEVSTIIHNTETYLEAVSDLGITKPVMGVLPPISEDCTQALMDLYMNRDLRAYCVDFNRRSPMAESQLDNVVNPLMQTLTHYDIREDSFVYAVNAKNRSGSENGRRTADSMYSFTLGFDVVGDNHISPNFPEEVFEKIREQSEEGEVDLRLFDSDSVSIVEVPVSDLRSFLPEDAEIPIDRVQERISADPGEQYRFEKVINTELISLYLNSKGGIAPEEIFGDLLSGDFTQDSDIERVRELVSEVQGDN